MFMKFKKNMLAIGLVLGIGLGGDYFATYSMAESSSIKNPAAHRENWYN